MNLSSRLERSVWEYPKKPAVVDPYGTTTTYEELRAQSNRIGNVLAAHGVKPGDVVVSVMPDDATHVATFYAVIRLGAAFSGLDYPVNAEKLLADVARSQAKIAIVHPDYAHIASCSTARPPPKTCCSPRSSPSSRNRRRPSSASSIAHRPILRR